jgi:hypothetical protein
MPPALPGLVALVGRVAPLAAAVAKGVRWLAFASFASTAVVAVAVLSRGLPDSVAEVAAALVAIGLLAVPGVVLLVFHGVLSEVAEVPERLRRLPDVGREHGAELGRVVEDVRSTDRPAWRRMPFALWGLFRFGRSSRSLLTPYAPALALLSPPFLALVALAAVATVVEALIAAIVILVVASG